MGKVSRIQIRATTITLWDRSEMIVPNKEFITTKLVNWTLSDLDDPAPHALLLGFGDDAVNIELRFVVDFGLGLATKDAVQMSIDRAFREKGIEFALPKSEVQLISDAPTVEGREVD